MSEDSPGRLDLPNTTMTSARTLIIGLDGATFDLIDPLMSAGDLPALERIRAEGVSGQLQTWPNTNSAAAWSSMVTGYNSGQHGIYHFGEAITRRGAAWHPVTGTDRKKDAFWRTLSKAGQQIGVINVPITYPAEQINGFMLAGMDTPGIGSPGFAHPREVVQELRREGIDYVIDVANLGPASRRDPNRLPASVEQMIDARARAILHLMKSRPWNALMAVFVATDRVQHYFWPAEGSSTDHPTWAPIRAVYRQIDSFLASALELAGGDTTVLVVSDHGFGPTQPAKRGLDQLFAQLGLLGYRQGSNRAKGTMLNQLLVYGRRLIPHSLQDPLARALPGLHLRAVNEHRFGAIDWTATRVFAGPTGGRVCVNLQGRERDGTVSPEDYEELRERVRDILLSLTDAESGKRLIRAVHRREDIHTGPYTDQAADLLIEWDHDAARDSLCYSADGRQIVVTPSATAGNQWKGSHRPEGIFLARGPNIKQGENVAGARIYDIAPTILYLHDHPTPENLDGKVLTNIFTEDWLRKHSPRQYHPTETGERPPTDVLDSAEAAQIEARLRGLGYIE